MINVLPEGVKKLKLFADDIKIYAEVSAENVIDCLALCCRMGETMAIEYFYQKVCSSVHE